MIKILLLVLLIAIPLPFGYLLIERAFLSSSKNNLFHGDLPVNEIPSDYYPFNRKFFFEIPKGPCKGQKLFYHDTVYGKEAPVHTIMFVHGNPASSYVFRDIIDSVKQRTKETVRIVAMDHIGFGLSDRAERKLLPKDHADNLLQLVQYLDLSDIILVLHDWGGPIGIGAFLHAPSTISGLVLLNTTVFPLSAVDIIFHHYGVSTFGRESLTPYIPEFGYGRYAAYSIYHNPAMSIFGKLDFIQALIFGIDRDFSFADKEAISFFSNHLRSKQNIENSRLLYENALYFNSPQERFNLTDKPAMDTFIGFITENISEKWGPEGLNIPARGYFGDHDMASDPVFVGKWTSALPQLNGHITIVENCGHYFREDHSQVVAEGIGELMEDASTKASLLKSQ